MRGIILTVFAAVLLAKASPSHAQAASAAETTATRLLDHLDARQYPEAEALFTDKERAALAWAETLTRVAETNAPDADYQQAAAVLGQKELADVTMAVALMNAFNRIGVGMRLVPAALAK